jgi:hypothetical protein
MKMQPYNNETEIGLVGIGSLLAIVGGALDAYFLVLIGLVMAGIGLFKMIWYS